MKQNANWTQNKKAQKCNWNNWNVLLWFINLPKSLKYYLYISFHNIFWFLKLHIFHINMIQAIGILLKPNTADPCQKKLGQCNHKGMPPMLPMPPTLAHHSQFLASSSTLHCIGYFSHKSCLLAMGQHCTGNFLAQCWPR